MKFYIKNSNKTFILHVIKIGLNFDVSNREL
jgi:hypothetical protein